LQAVLDDIRAIYGLHKDKPVLPCKDVRKQLAAACKKIGIPPLNHHDLRAWFITWGITSGIDISTLADWVGNSPKVLLERYAAVQDEQKKASALKLL
jgi:integrase